MAGKNEVILTFAGDTKQLEKAFGRVGQGADKLGNNVDASGRKTDSWREKFGKFNRVAVGASLAVGAAVAKVGIDSFKLSQDLTNLDAKSQAVFGGQLNSMRAWADENKAAFGTSRDQVVGLAANMADLLKPMGFTSAEAANMSKEMLNLSGALSQWSGGQRTAAEVSEILTKAMLGERDELKGLGISISEADVQTRLAKNGQEELTGAALEQAKAVATQQLIMEKSTDAQAAWTNGGKAAAEAQNASKVTMQELQEALARGLTPAFEAGTKIIAAFAGWAEKNQGTVAVLAGAIVGLAGAVLIINGAFKAFQAITVLATAAQWLLNTALFSNPIGLVILAIVALGAALVIAYRKSETFRRIVQSAFRGVQAAGSFVVAKVKEIGSWFSRLPGRIRGAFSTLASAISAPFRRAFSAIRGAWNSTIGGKGFSIPSWVPGIGGNSFRIPTFHHGGIVPGAPGRETLGLLQAGERVIPRGGERIVLEIRSGGSRMDDFLVEVLQGAIRDRGGKVSVLGRLA